MPRISNPAQVFSIKQTRKGRETIISKTLPELIEYFGYTLEIGASYDKKVNRNPKNIQAFMTNLQRAYDAKEACCYERTSVELVETPAPAAVAPQAAPAKPNIVQPYWC
jgi:hypothetical protein